MFDWSQFPNFSAAEMACKDGSPYPENADTLEFMERLQTMRNYLNFAFKITSAFRSEEYNKSIGGAASSMHLKGLAVDIGCYGQAAYLIIASAPRYGFAGIGVRQKGDYSTRFIHLDTRSTSAIWSY